MSRTHLVIPDIHAHYEHDNNRAKLLSSLIMDLRPDVVINMGDQWDFPSLSSYDRGKKSFQGRTYRADVDTGLEFSDRLWGPIRKRKKRLPERYFFEGNHEERIARAIQLQPELEGAIGFENLELDRDYDHIVRYCNGAPGIEIIDGVAYSHYFTSGVMGRPISGEHPSYYLLTKRFRSCTQGHTHILDFCERTMDDKKIFGLVAGCFTDYAAEWAGNANQMWWRGVIIKYNVEDGMYDPEFISLRRLEKEYGVT